jgi:hypothetical protein
MTPYRAYKLWVLIDRRKEAHVALALMIPLVMIMLLILMQSLRQSRFSKQNHLGEILLLDGSDPALRIGVQVSATVAVWAPA